MSRLRLAVGLLFAVFTFASIAVYAQDTSSESISTESTKTLSQRLFGSWFLHKADVTKDGVSTNFYGEDPNGMLCFDESGNYSLMVCLLYTSPSPRDQRGSRMPSSA